MAGYFPLDKLCLRLKIKCLPLPSRVNFDLFCFYVSSLNFGGKFGRTSKHKADMR